MQFSILIALVGIVLLLVISQIMKASGGSMSVLRETAFGSRERERPLARIASFWRETKAAEHGIDDRTWDDLDMDAVFASMDRTASAVGQQALYARLRNDDVDLAALARVDSAADRFSSDEKLRVAVVGCLRRLDDSRALLLAALFTSDLPSRPAYWPVFPVLTAGAVTSLLAVVSNHPRAALVLIAIACVNLVLGLALRWRVDPVAGALNMTAALIRAARELAELQCPEIEEHLAVIRRHVDDLRRVKLATGWLAFEPGQTNEIASTLYEYANLLLGLNLNAFAFGVEEIRRRRLALRAVLDAIGAIDTAYAIGSWRATLPVWSRPDFAPRAQRMTFDGLAHPLLASPVANDLRVRDQSILVTGSNMSGKTTFIRAVGINALLARSVFTVCATRWVAPPLVVQSSIGRADDVLSGKSYYLAEVESIGRLVAAARDGRQHLFIIDEIFRGTNTTERIAAGQAVLNWLGTGDNIVFVATHDLELLGLLAGRYEPFHFREQVEADQLSFDYRLRPGVSSTRNAIALLRLTRFPDALVQDALDAAARMERAPRLGGQSPA